MLKGFITYVVIYDLAVASSNKNNIANNNKMEVLGIATIDFNKMLKVLALCYKNLWDTTTISNYHILRLAGSAIYGLYNSFDLRC